MTLKELFEQTLVIFPNAAVEGDNEGQVVIYTGLKQVSPYEDDELETLT